MQARGPKCLCSRPWSLLERFLKAFVSLWVALFRWVLWCYQRSFGSQSALVIEHTSGYWTSVCCQFPPFSKCWGCATVIAGSMSALWNRPHVACGRNPAPLCWPSCFTHITC